MIGIIAGSGLHNIEGLSLLNKTEIETAFGMPSGPLAKYSYQNRDVVFLARHGEDHSIAPHKVNYRANIMAFKESGVTNILSISAVGGIRSNYTPGRIVIADQILDFTRSRRNTFFEENDVVHVDFSDPYCARMRKTLFHVARETGIVVEKEGTYVAVEGPRLETSAEISMFRSHGADIVGMTAMPEAVLAREAEICYTGVYVVTNHAAGTTGARLTTEEVIRTMKASETNISTLLLRAILLLDDDSSCSCRNALKEARM